MGDIETYPYVIPVEEWFQADIWESLKTGKDRVLLWLKVGPAQSSWQMVRFDLLDRTNYRFVHSLSSEITLTLGNVGLSVEPDSIVALGNLKENRQHYGPAILLAGEGSSTGFIRERLPKRGNPYDVLYRQLRSDQK